MNPPDLGEQFWHWSLAFYRDPTVAEACLTLQDQHGADVNVVLVLLWQASLGAAPFAAGEVAALDAAIADWRAEVIVPLRSLRRALKGRGEDAVRQPVATAELAAERSAQGRLVQALPPFRQGEGSVRERAAESLRCYAPGVAGSAEALLDRLPP